MIKVHLDFETRSTVNIQECGAWVYSTHPSTAILCLVYAIGDQKPILIKRHDACESLHQLAQDPNVVFVAHNAFFERSIWENILCTRYNFPSLPISRWRCTMAKANMCAIPKSLERASQALMLEHTKDTDGRRVMLKLSKPRNPRKKEDPTKVYWYEDEKDFETLCRYCITDVLTERALDQALPDLTPNEQEIWELDQEINDRGVCIDIPTVKIILSFMEKLEQELTEEVRDITNGHINKVSRRQQVLNWMRTQGVDIDNTQKATIVKLLEQDLPEHVRRVLEIKIQLGQTSTAKYKAMINACSEDNKLRDTLLYHSASTGRWGGKLVQLHNLPRGDLKKPDVAIDIFKENDLDLAKTCYKNLMNAFSSTIRGMIIASPGHELIVADYSAIEARVLAWLAQDQDTVSKFHNNVDLYIDIAKKIYDTQEVTKEQRALGKVTILGCGYGMGAKKFRLTCANWGIDISDEMAETVVQTYRQTYSSIRNMWYAQENAAISVIQGSSEAVCGYIIWRYERPFLTCQLPSGRKLYYFKPELQMVETPWGEEKLSLTYMTVDSQTKQFVRTKTYGGHLVENITQAVARDIMATSMFNCNAQGYKVILTVHDEIVTEVPENGYSVENFINILTAPISWAQNCPIAAEGWKGKRYRK